MLGVETEVETTMLETRSKQPQPPRESSTHPLSAKSENNVPLSGKCTRTVQKL